MSKQKIARTVARVALIVALLLTACTQPKEVKGKPMLAYVPAGPPGPEFGSALLLSMQTYAEREGFTFVSTAPPGGDIRRQMELIESYVGEGVDALVIWPIDSSAIAAAIETANKANIPVIALDRQIWEGDLLVTVQSDNEQAARLAGEKMVEMLIERHGEAKGKVLEIQWPQTSDVMIMRSSSFQEAIKEHPGIELITKLCENVPAAERLTLDVLAAHPDLDGIYGPFDAIFPSVAGALEQVDRWYPRDDPRHVFTASIDATSQALDMIRQGYYDVSVSQPVTHFGVSARLAREALEQDKKPKPGDKVEEEGAYWSPATVIEGKNGPLLLMQCIAAESSNVDSITLWANALKEWKVE